MGRLELACLVFVIWILSGLSMEHMRKRQCYDLSREPAQVELCKELFGDK